MSASTLAASAWKLVSAASRMERTEAKSKAGQLARRDFEDAESELRQLFNVAPGSTLPGKHFQKILVAVDGSPAANWALEVASDLARSLNAQIGLVNAYMAPVGIATEFAYDTCVSDSLREAGRKILFDAKSRLPESLKSETFLQEGNATEEILSIAKSWGADLIVLGTRAHRQFLVGSTAQAVGRKSSCPVMMISHQPAVTPADQTSTACAEEEPVNA
jgi:nucleotide-binding universal stress UspA family protein